MRIPFAVRSVAAMAATMLCLAGCLGGAKAPKFVAASGEARIEAAPPTEIAWKADAVEGEGRAPAAPLGDGDSVGLRVAAATPPAVAAARENLKSKVAILQAPGGESLSRFMASREDAAASIEQLLGTATTSHRYDAKTEEVVATARLELAPVAAAVEQSVAAKAVATLDPDQAAREKALRDARLQLRSRLLELKVTKRLTVADQIKWDVVLENEVAKAIRNARTVRDQKVGTDSWAIELQADTKSIVETANREK